ncbi:MAG: uroporphyrinogen III decarboxylase [Clostridiales bacterium]|nr:uroporphyrinogen III decarboxylase [Clostridiales bacterium]
MTKRERVIAAIEGRETDGIPSAFSLHFPPEQKLGAAGVEAHLKFFQEADTDMIKIMNEYRLPINGVIRTPEEYNQAIPRDYRHQQFLKNQLEFTKNIMERADKEAFSMGTLHGACPSSYLPFMNMGDGYTVPEGNHLLAAFLRWNETIMLEAMQRVTDGLCDLAEAYIKEAGLDGVYYAAPGGASKWLTDEEHAKWIKPFDIQIMKSIKEAGGYCILHICQSNVNMNRFDKDYAELADVVNWGVYDVPMSLEEGRKHFLGKTVLGGLANHSGAMVNGTAEEVRQEVQRIVKGFGRRALILGADCTLATNQDLLLVKAAVQEARSL